MELAFEMVEQLLCFPVNECNEGFALISGAAENAGVEMLFSTNETTYHSFEKYLKKSKSFHSTKSR